MRVLGLGWVLTVVLLSGCSESREDLQSPVQEQSVAAFGAQPNDDLNDLPALREALDACRLASCRRLVIPPGTYILRDDEAVRLRDQVMRGEFGFNPEREMFRPYRPYVRGLDFTGIEELVVEASGAEFLVEGWMEPISLERCRDVTIRGLTIDYARPPFSLGRIQKVTASYFDVEFEPRFPVNDGIPIPRVMLWDEDRDQMLGTCVYPDRLEMIGPQILRLYGRCPEGAMGALALAGHSFHFRPAVFIHEAADIVLDEVAIHSQPGMGIVGHRAKDLLFRRLRITPRAGLPMSTNTDATHFTTCSGSIRFEDCQFEGHGDDATNIHNYYYTVAAEEGAQTYQLTVEAPTGTHAQVLDAPQVGETLELVERRTLRAVESLETTAVELFPEEWRAVVKLDRPIEGELEDYFLINVSALPRVEIVGCQVRSHRARAFLIKTRDVLIEGNTIENTTGTAIHVGAEGAWHEGPTAENIRIRRNRIVGCGTGEGTQNQASGIAVNVHAPDTTVPGLHQNILIEGNQIIGRDAARGIFVSGAGNVTIRYNQVAGCSETVVVEHSEQVAVYENR